MTLGDYFGGKDVGVIVLEVDKILVKSEMKIAKEKMVRNIRSSSLIEDPEDSGCSSNLAFTSREAVRQLNPFRPGPCRADSRFAIRSQTDTRNTYGNKNEASLQGKADCLQITVVVEEQRNQITAKVLMGIKAMSESDLTYAAHVFGEFQQPPQASAMEGSDGGPVISVDDQGFQRRMRRVSESGLELST